MKKGIGIALLLAAAAMCLFASAAYAQAPKKPDTKRQEMFADLGLSPEQRKALEDNRNRHKEQTTEVVTQLRRKMGELRQELEKNELDMQAVGRINGELKQLQGRMLDNRLERILEVRKILTPEQFKKFEDKMHERKKVGKRHL